jgi:hypothetical protein
MFAARTLVSLAIAALGSACVPHLASNMIVDGVPFSPTRCASGARLGFSGVELVDSDGRRLRVGWPHDNRTPALAYYPQGAAIGQLFPACGKVNMRNGPARVNGVQEVDGTVTLACSIGQHSFSGTIEFEGCH